MKKILSTALIFSAFFLLLSLPTNVLADDITATVTIGNDPPAFTTDAVCTGTYPCESPARSAASPVNVGTSTTFRATADEPNAENYYLIVCKSDSFTTNNGAAPECASAELTVCVSTSTADGVAATCNYTALQADAELTNWYARVCDNNATSQQCSTTSQGNTGGAPDEASPLHVNHAPNVTSVSNDAETAPAANDPLTNVTWTTVASDPDTTSVDTISLHVCSSNSFTGGSCAATTLCSHTAQASNPTCAYAIPAGTSASDYPAYAFIIDNHGFNESVSTQSDYFVANVAPEVLSIATNGGTEITLTGGESVTTNISFVATVQDNNGCGDVNATPTSAVLYRSSVTNGATCTGNTNNCYTGTVGAFAVTCDIGASCTGGTDVDVVYTCTAAMQYHSDPTVANTPWSADTWLSFFDVADIGTLSDSATATGVNLNTLVALDSGNLNYGTMSADSTDTDLDNTNEVTNTGNTALDAQVSSAAPMTDGGVNEIAVNNQRFAASQVVWASGTALSGSLQTVAINTTKTTVTASPETDFIYWGINIPENQFPGVYTGTTTVAAMLMTGWN